MSNAEEIMIDVTEEEYLAELASGLQEDEVLKPGRHQFKRGGFLARHGIKPQDAATTQVQVRVLLNLDLDILTYFEQKATKSEDGGYQTQINKTLRDSMEREQAAFAFNA